MTFIKDDIRILYKRYSGTWTRRGRGGFSRNLVLGLCVFLTMVSMMILGFLPERKKAGRPVSVQSRLDFNEREFLDAVRDGDFKAVQAGLRAGVNVNVQNEFGESALHLVRDPRLASFLIENGADVHLREEESGMTPLFIQERPVADILVKAGADVNARSYKRNTPFLWYTYSGYRDGLEFLISAGADIQARNTDGQTALDIADAFGTKELIEFLEGAGVRREPAGRKNPERF